MPRAWKSPARDQARDMFGLSSGSLREDCWGDPMAEEPPDTTLRVATINVGGLPTQANHPKYQSLQAFALSNDVDILCLTEVNVAWQHVEESAHVSQIVRPWFRSTFCRTAWYKAFPSESPRQPGGVALLIRGAHAGRVMQSGQDESGLGWWVWARLRGPRGQSLLVVCAYRPVYHPRDLYSV